jgi:hypothetical protein
MKKYIVIVSVVIILAVVGGAGWYLKERRTEGNPPVTATENLPSDIENQKSAIINTDDWQTYRNEEYGFEVKYPREWEIKNSNPVFESIITLASPETARNIKEAVGRGRSTEIPRGDIVISIIDTKGQKLIDYLNYNLEIQKSGVSYIDLVKFNEMAFYDYVAYEALLGGVGSYYAVYIEDDQKVYRILFELKADKNQLSDEESKIINSFKFIN